MIVQFLYNWSLWNYCIMLFMTTFDCWSLNILYLIMLYSVLIARSNETDRWDEKYWSFCYMTAVLSEWQAFCLSKCPIENLNCCDHDKRKCWLCFFFTIFCSWKDFIFDREGKNWACIHASKQLTPWACLSTPFIVYCQVATWKRCNISTFA